MNKPPSKNYLINYEKKDNNLMIKKRKSNQKEKKYIKYYIYIILNTSGLFYFKQNLKERKGKLRRDYAHFPCINGVTVVSLLYH